MGDKSHEKDLPQGSAVNAARSKHLSHMEAYQRMDRAGVVPMPMWMSLTDQQLSACKNANETDEQQVATWVVTTLDSLPSKFRKDQDKFFSRHAETRTVRVQETTMMDLGSFSVRCSLPPLSEPESAGTLQRASTEEMNRESLESLMNEMGMADTELIALPDEGEVLRRLCAQASEVDEKERSRLLSAFNRFKMPQSSDLHKDDLVALLSWLGFVKVEPDTVTLLALEVTKYSTLEFEDFLTFLGAYTRHEIESYYSIFKTFDIDSTGGLSKSQLAELLTSLGITPLRRTVQEAWDIVNCEKASEMGFEQMVYLILIYKETEGFTREEVLGLKRAFAIYAVDCEGGEAELPPDKLTAMLVRYFGPLCKELAASLGEQAVQGMCTTKKPDPDLEPDPPIYLRFREALLWSRRLRELEHRKYKAIFETYDKDSSGKIDRSELGTLMSEFGYTVSKATCDEFVSRVDEDFDGQGKDGQLDFDEFVNFMWVLRRQDGFAKDECREISKVFLRFDTDKSGQIDTLELNSILRFMGYTTSLEDAQVFLAEVDFDGSGDLDYFEFQKLMRLHREAYLSAVHEVFNNFLNNDGKLSRLSLPMALRELGHEPVEFSFSLTAAKCLSDALAARIQARGQGSEFVDFDEFVDTVEARRAVHVIRSRRCAGFSNAEVDLFRQIFESYVKYERGFIPACDIGPLLEEFGIELKTQPERDRAVSEIDRARRIAYEVGVEDAGRPGDPINFWVTLQWIRIVSNSNDKVMLERETEAMAQTRFKASEVNSFRETFAKWYLEQEASAGVVETPREEMEVSTTGYRSLTRATIRLLLTSLGLTVKTETRIKLAEQIDALSVSGVLDFPDFLRLMRWMMDTNFAGISEMTSKPSPRSED